MKTPYVLVSLLVVLSACIAPSPEEVAAATLYFPPQFKRIAEPRFCFSSAERERALQGCREDGADTLFEIVIDAKGKVEKVRLIRTHVDPDYQQDMLDHANGFGFTPDATGSGYRAFFFPVKYHYQSEFEWIDKG